MEEGEEQEDKELKELFQEALRIKDKLGLPSVDTALLMLIQQDLDQLRFHNTE